MGGTTPVLWASDLDVQWRVLLDLLLALVLCTVIGIERELAAKSAGLRTHALVGVGSAAFMLISKYGFGDLLALDHVSLDPSRVAAQIVSGIGFIGGGLIFVRRDAVRGPDHRGDGVGGRRGGRGRRRGPAAARRRRAPSCTT